MPQIRNCMGTVAKVGEFFHASPKREAALRYQIEKLILKARVTHLKSLCPTRWVQRHDALNVFVKTFSSQFCLVSKTLVKARMIENFCPKLKSF